MSIDNATPQEWNKSVLTLGDYIETKLPASQRQVQGNHYKGTNIQSWDVFLDWQLDPWACNVIKYVQRHRKKAGKHDLEKALHYLEYMIEKYDEIGQAYYK
jgi:hypothetical protein